jgi:hypothetical protein
MSKLGYERVALKFLIQHRFKQLEENQYVVAHGNPTFYSQQTGSDPGA